MANTKPASKKPKNTPTPKPPAKKAAAAAPPAKKAAPNVDAIKQLSERIQSIQVELEGLNTAVGENIAGDTVHERLEKLGADLAERGDAIMDVLRPLIPDDADDVDEDDDALDPFAEIDERFTAVEKSLGLVHAKLDAMIANFGVPYEAPPEPEPALATGDQPAGDDQSDGEAQPTADTVDAEDEDEDEDEDDDQGDGDGADNAGTA